ncbi:MAG: type III pantothenate kinase [Nitrospiraceae bacterium]|nr:type III pantothenate kinase [Nitrospiraceae bacterium]
MLLAINIGNTNTYMAFFAGEEPFIHRVPTHPLKSAADYIQEIERQLEKYGFEERPDAAALCSVVPSHNGVFLEALELILGGKKARKPLVISHLVVPEMKFDVENPAGVGADRIAAAYGAWRLYGGPVCCVDMGTATTLNFVTSGGLFLGGSILAGAGLMRDSLQSATAGLPYVEIERTQPSGPIGTNTTGAILSGIIYGTAGAISRIMEEAELERLMKFKVALTGGGAGLVAPYLKRLDFHEPALALKGIRLIHLRA